MTHNNLFIFNLISRSYFSNHIKSENPDFYYPVFNRPDLCIPGFYVLPSRRIILILIVRTKCNIPTYFR